MNRMSTRPISYFAKTFFETFFQLYSKASLNTVCTRLGHWTWPFSTFTEAYTVVPVYNSLSPWLISDMWTFNNTRNYSRRAKYPMKDFFPSQLTWNSYKWGDTLETVSFQFDRFGLCMSPRAAYSTPSNPVYTVSLSSTLRDLLSDTLSE